ncbi:ATP-grasp domain-containing protein [Oceaniradius stylonematis]|uniref:ATP-grasp domain-containing protein n=1 Tax=Oceaniradius stylonematis TaxID=2184161 RepID=UPI00273D266A|nr:ATP-grasp domain-containing protein [Oceaniradius stylonematis]
MTVILLTDISSYKSAVIARHLARTRPNVRVIATDHRPYTRRLHTRWARDVRLLPCPPSAGAPYVEALGEIIRNDNVDLMVPVNSDEMRAIMAHPRPVGATLDYTSGAETYVQLDDKAAFSELIDRLDLPQPSAYDSLDAPLPVVVKPAKGSSAQGVHYVHTETERGALMAKLGERPEGHVIQEYVSGEGVGYSGFFRDGQILTGYAHRRVFEYPITGGSSVVRSRYDHDDLPALEALVRRLLAEVPYSGFAMFEFKRRGPGDFFFIECNPRVWGSIHQGLADGADYFAPLLGDAALAKRAEKAPRTGLFPLNALVALRQIQAGRWGDAFRVVRSAPFERLDIHPLGDPLGILALMMRGR